MLRTLVASPANRVGKSWIRAPSLRYRRATIASAAAERSAGATGSRLALAVRALSSKSHSRQPLRRHSTQQASRQRKVWARTAIPPTQKGHCGPWTTPSAWGHGPLPAAGNGETRARPARAIRGGAEESREGFAPRESIASNSGARHDRLFHHVNREVGPTHRG